GARPQPRRSCPSSGSSGRTARGDARRPGRQRPLLKQHLTVANRPALFLLIGFAGTGKLTVARVLRDRLAAHGAQVRLVDNHYINNPILHLIDVDGEKPLPAGTWDRVGEVRDAVFRTIEMLSPKSWSFIFT